MDVLVGTNSSAVVVIHGSNLGKTARRLAEDGVTASSDPDTVLKVS